jgi:CubicO group peptidase (beta-lactamase class C family)
MAWASLLPLLIAPGVANADAVDDYVRAQMALNHIPGLAVAVVKEGRVVKMQAYGMANLEWQQPVDVDTAFQLASSTKPLTGILLMRLVEQGQLSLDESITHYLPDAPATWRPITLRHLAGHASGIPDDIDVPAGASLAEYVRAAGQRALVHPPGARADYGIAGYIVLRHIIERVGGGDFKQLLRLHVLDPLAMSSTAFDGASVQGDIRTADLVPRRAGIYEWDQDRQRNFSFLFGERGYAAGGLLSSARDLSRLLVALDGVTLLKREFRDQMWQPMTLGDGRANSFAVGWAISDVDGRRGVGHSGGPALSDLLLLPEQRLGVVVLANAERMYPYLARGVAALYLPAPAPATGAGIADAKPKLTASFLKVLRDASGDAIDESHFAPAARPGFIAGMRDFLLPYFRSLPTADALHLLSEHDSDGRLRRTYRAQHGRQVVTWQVDFDADGLILGFGPK